MARRRLAMQLECLGLPFRAAAAAAARLGCAGVLLRAEGAFAPRQLSQSGRREVRHRVLSENLDWAALVCPLDQGLEVESGLEERLSLIREVMQLAFELGPRTVIIAAGQVPEAEDDPRRTLLAAVLADLGRWGDRIGARLLLEAGLEPLRVLNAFLDRIGGGSLGVSIDPAHLLLHRHDLTAALHDVHGRLGHVYLRDARPQRLDRLDAEVPLGAGEVNWLAFMGTLEEIGYHGWLTLKRGPMANPMAEMAAAVQFYRQIQPDAGSPR